MCQTAETPRCLRQLLVAHHLMFQQQLGLLEYPYCSKQPKRTTVISCIGVFQLILEIGFSVSQHHGIKEIHVENLHETDCRFVWEDNLIIKIKENS